MACNYGTGTDTLTAKHHHIRGETVSASVETTPSRTQQKGDVKVMPFPVRCLYYVLTASLILISPP